MLVVFLLIFVADTKIIFSYNFVVDFIEYNIRNIFLEKLYTKRGGETSPRPFSKKLKLRMILDQ